MKIPAPPMLGLHLEARRPQLVGDEVHDTVAGLELAGDTEEGRVLTSTA